MGQDLVSVFADAALPQKVVLVVLILAILAALLLAATRRGGGSRFISDLRVAGPAVGLLVAALNGFHMAQTILRLPSSPTARDLAPALMEMAVLVGLGALAGLVAVALRRAPR
ncbi:hypothetical protein JKL49_19130 [Phenylobacterium sp. 20VBR1]|uniref:MotA/TolQ/ExbB proton channel domain-containing protein n=1 Tax=Phenylobacterium glaciei TaxID=2803784 RepID=A0A941HY04_9CAUL|nr:hypothetical protein [Phenylobacterium glaciei]MBR7621513.1 hypothetical protein [Phenylobacterium glaciei]QQZ50233.1 hypothetical protein JKL49_00315 [Phenylobacterium glaciei]